AISHAKLLSAASSLMTGTMDAGEVPLSFAGLLGFIPFVLDPLQQLESTRHTARNLKSLQAEVSALYEILQRLGLLVVGSETEESIVPDNLLRTCQETLRSIMKLIENYHSSPKFTRVITLLIQQDDIERLKRDLDRQKSTFALALSSYASMRISSTNVDIRALHDQLERMQSLSAVQMQNYELKLRESTEAVRLSGTCEWLIQSPVLSSWRQSDSGVFILIGTPGSGKSVLLSKVVDELQLEANVVSSQAVAYFYIDYREGAHQMLSRVISTLLRQLLQQLPSLPLDIIRAYENTGYFGRKLTYSQLVEELICAAGKFRRVYLCIDALDELAEEEQHDLFRFIEKISRARVRVLVSSRKTRQLDVFLQESTLEVGWVYQLDISENDDLSKDITRYVESTVQSSGRLKGKLELQQQIVDRISGLSQGMFLWVDLVLRDLVRQRTPKEMQMSIDSMPVGMHGLYGRLLSQMEDAVDSQRTIGKLTIAILLKADGAVSFTETCGMLKRALQYRTSPETSLDSATIMEACGGFVLLEPSKGYLRFIHNSAKEFLATNLHFKEVDLPPLAGNIAERQVSSQEAQKHYDAHVSRSSSIAFGSVYDNDTEETASRGSWSSSVFSNASSTSSQSSIFSQLETVTDQFARLFATHQDLRLIILESLNKQGIAGFEHSFSRLLRDYSRELQLIAKGNAPSEQVAALMVGQRTRDIARETVIMSGYLDNVKTFSGSSQRDEDPGKVIILDRFLQEKDKGFGNNSLPSPTTGLQVSREIREKSQPLPQKPFRTGTEAEYLFNDKHEQEEEEEIQEEVIEVYVNVQRVQQFLILNAPFAKLTEQLRLRLEPRLTIPEIKGLEPEPELVVKLAHGTLQRKVVAKISAWTRNVWQYKLRPALGGETPLEPGMKRVRWTCVCDRRYYDDFIEIEPGAVAQVQASLNDTYRREIQVVPAQSTPILVDYPRVLSPITEESLLDSPPEDYLGLHVGTPNSERITYSPANNQDGNANRSRSAVTSQLQGPNFSESGDLGIQRLSGGNAETGGRREQDPNPSEVRTRDWVNAEIGDANSKQTLWIIPCFRNPKGDDQVVQVRVSDRTLDGALFSRFRREYFMISNWWRCFVKMHEVTVIKFVMVNAYVFGRYKGIGGESLSHFGLIAGDKPEEHIADILKTDVWPPKAEPPEPQMWLYEPCPAETIPLVGQKYLMKVWRESHHADALTYEEWRQHAAWYGRVVDWIRHAFPRWVQKILGDWGLDQNAGNLELEGGIRPSGLSRAYFQQPTHVQRSRRAIIAIPKKIGKKVEPDLSGVKREEVWGLQFEESFTIHRLLFYILVWYFLGSLVAVAHLSRGTMAPMPLTNKLAILAWFASFVTLFFTVWIKWAETPK
ncbi:MAG: hypothetical protein Q9187_001474, partial [Circinaria calcarea]